MNPSVIGRRPASPVPQPKRATRLPYACTDYRPARPAQPPPSPSSLPRFVARSQTALSFLRLGQIDPVLAKFRWPLGEVAPAQISFFWRRSGIDNLFDR